MSTEELKAMLKEQEVVLELVQVSEGEFALRAAEISEKPLVKIEFNEEVKALLGDDAPALGQHMIQAALYGLMEQQMKKWHAEVIDERPAFLS